MFLSQRDGYAELPLYRYLRDGQWRTMSWRAARERVRDIACALSARGIAEGDRVAMYFPNRVEWCLADWANICIGALTVPIYASGTAAQAAHILSHSGAAALFVDSAEKLKRLEG